MTDGYSSQDRRLMAIFSMTRPELRIKIVLQGIAFIILVAAFIFFSNALLKIEAANAEASSDARITNTLPSLLSDLNLILPISLLGVLFGIACAFYLQEWLPETNWVRRVIESQVDFLNGIPSLLYGLLAVVVFFGYDSAFKVTGTPPIQNVRESGLEVVPFQRNTAMFYAETLIFIFAVMPVAIKTTQEALRSVGTSIRESTYALGANRWQVLTKQVVPRAFPQMLAGGCRAMSRSFAVAALLIGIHIWNHTTAPRGIPDRFMLFLGAALLLSAVSSFLTEMYDPASTQLD